MLSNAFPACAGNTYLNVCVGDATKRVSKESAGFEGTVKAEKSKGRRRGGWGGGGY